MAQPVGEVGVDGASGAVEQPGDRVVVGEGDGDEPVEAGGGGTFEERLDEGCADAAPLVAVLDQHGELAAPGLVAGAVEVDDADQLGAGRGDEREAVVAVDVDETAERRRPQPGLGREVAAVAGRLRAAAVEPHEGGGVAGVQVAHRHLAAVVERTTRRSAMSP